MARSDQVMRQWYVLRKLESPRGATLTELADAIPADYGRHPRTIRREQRYNRVASAVDGADIQP